MRNCRVISGQRFFWVMGIPKDDAGEGGLFACFARGVCGEDEGDGVGVPGLGSAAAHPGAPCGPLVREPLQHREHLGGRPDDRMAVPGGPDDERHPAGPASGRRHPHQQHRRVAGHDHKRGFREGDSGPDGGAGQRRHEGESGADQRHDSEGREARGFFQGEPGIFRAGSAHAVIWRNALQVKDIIVSSTVDFPAHN